MLKRFFLILASALTALGAVGLHAAARRSQAEAEAFGKAGDQPSVAQLWKRSQSLRPSARRGRGYYEQDCMKCHGVKGGADGELASQLPGQMIRFNNAADMSARSDQDLFYDTAMGRERSAMPAWYPGYTGQQLADVVAYLRALQSGRPVPPSADRINHSAFLLAEKERRVREHSDGVNKALKRPKPDWVKRVKAAHAAATTTTTAKTK